MWRVLVFLICWLGVYWLADTFPFVVYSVVSLILVGAFWALCVWAWKLGDVREED